MENHMPKMNALVLKDASDVNHTYVPRSTQNGVSTLIETGAIPLGDNRLTLGINRTAAGRIKPQMKFTMPVVSTVTVDGKAKSEILRTGYADLSLNFDQSSTESERADVVLMIAKAIIQNADVLSVLAKNQDPY